jgi:F-type H+-transporting ATPase subunit delta
MSEYITVARPYAKAAFDFAVEQENLDGWQHMLTFAAEVSRNEEVRGLLSSSAAAEKLAEMFIAICGDQLDEYGQNFIKVMAENKRLVTLPDVLEQFMLYRADKESTIDVEVISADELNKNQRKKIIKAMQKRLSKKVMLNCKIDKSVMAGIIIRAGDMVIDGSVRGRLQRLADTLQS